MVVMEPLSDGYSAQGQVVDSRKGIKYLPSDLTFLGNVRPTKDIKDLFWKHMEFYHMTYEVMLAWEILAER